MILDPRSCHLLADPLTPVILWTTLPNYARILTREKLHKRPKVDWKLEKLQSTQYTHKRKTYPSTIFVYHLSTMLNYKYIFSHNNKDKGRNIIIITFEQILPGANTLDTAYSYYKRLKFAFAI